MIEAWWMVNSLIINFSWATVCKLFFCIFEMFTIQHDNLSNLYNIIYLIKWKKNIWKKNTIRLLRCAINRWDKLHYMDIIRHSGIYQSVLLGTKKDWILSPIISHFAFFTTNFLNIAFQYQTRHLNSPIFCYLFTSLVPLASPNKTPAEQRYS